ncbi:hypothetical protein [Campylobacter rectus]|uniref:hypothetical protein n=1 Tax=Campylobacter rectus TaxID=203 RepID=UPI000F5EC1A2|nr:hypothetical protein [Campylobacter rectus]RRD55525.1 hypothetical protein EII16_00570 [Campylobacter rectus]
MQSEAKKRTPFAGRNLASMVAAAIKRGAYAAATSTCRVLAGNARDEDAGQIWPAMKLTHFFERE